eukprot:4273279-Amphidinium_carterae.1
MLLVKHSQAAQPKETSLLKSLRPGLFLHLTGPSDVQQSAAQVKILVQSNRIYPQNPEETAKAQVWFKGHHDQKLFL